MSDHLQQYSAGAGGGGGVVAPYGTVTPRVSKALGRQLSRIQGAGLVRGGQIEVDTVISQQKVDAAISLGRVAQSGVTLLTQMEGELTKAVPLAGNRLEMLGNITTIQVADILADGVTRLRRM